MSVETAPERTTGRISGSPKRVHLFWESIPHVYLCGKTRTRRGPGSKTRPAGTVPCAECRSRWARLSGEAV